VLLTIHSEGHGSGSPGEPLLALAADLALQVGRDGMSARWRAPGRGRRGAAVCRAGSSFASWFLLGGASVRGRAA